jgi:chromate reductase, NAD(P)H dehydrogenase (quinone)
MQTIKQLNNLSIEQLNMITIIAGTNRKGSNTKKVAVVYKKLLAEKNIETKLLALDEVEVYERNASFETMENDYLKKTDKFIFVLPEYNGSFPGILKLMIDNSDVANLWHNKKALLTGVSSGRAGNLRGMEHLTGSLLHLKMTVHPNRLPISSIHTLLDEHGTINNAGTIKTMQTQLDEFLNF